MLTLDADWDRDLRHSPFRLRFELHPGGDPITMFTGAYDRARVLARSALGSAEVTAIVAGNPNAWSEDWAEARYGRKRESPFAVLADMGVDAGQPLATWQATPHPHHDDAKNWRWDFRALAVTWEEADILLWSNIGQEIGIRPAAPVLTTLIDRERAIAVTAYDDRGMDVTALLPEELTALYRHFDAWLLDDDRPRMAEAFAR